jgi:hypothetical protein
MSGDSTVLRLRYRSLGIGRDPGHAESGTFAKEAHLPLRTGIRAGTCVPE